MIYGTNDANYHSFLSVRPKGKQGGNNTTTSAPQVKAKGSDGKYQGEM
jgi:hypothetical protein